MTTIHGPRHQLAGLVTVPEAARRLGVTRQRIHQLLEEGRMAYVWASDRRLIYEHSLERLKAERAQKGV